MKRINQKVVKYFEMLANERRLKILMSISKTPLNVSSIQRSVGDITISGISHQLRLMSDSNIVKYKKKGRKKYYTLSDEYCWCPLRDTFEKFKKKTKCPHCNAKRKHGEMMI